MNVIPLAFPGLARCYFKDLIITFDALPDSEKVNVRIHNLATSQFKTLSLSPAVLENTEIPSEKRDYSKRLRWLLRHDYFPICEDGRIILQKLIGRSSEVLSPDFLLSLVDAAIFPIKREIVFESDDELWICPITRGVVRVPMVTNCGHTFDREAIIRSLEEDRRCPVCQENVTKITPNHVITSQIENKVSAPLIPILSILRGREVKEDQKMANTCQKSAQNYMKEGDFDRALIHYEDSFKYTNCSTFYEPIIKVFIGQKQHLKVVLACLILERFN